MDVKIITLILVLLLLALIGCKVKTENDNSMTAQAIYESNSEKDALEYEAKEEFQDLESAKESITQPAEESEDAEMKNVQAADDATKTEIINETVNETKAEPQCEQGWKCAEFLYRAYQLSDCSWDEVEKCQYQCSNGTCIGPPKCPTYSLKCEGRVLMECDEDGVWIRKETCDDLCEDERCVNIQDESTPPSASNPGLEECKNCVKVESIHPDGYGNECSNATSLIDEFVIFKNDCENDCGLFNWSVDDSIGEPYYFPEFVFEEGKKLNLSSGCGTNTNDNLFWCSKRSPCKAIWNNDYDSVILHDKNGNLMLNYTY